MRPLHPQPREQDLIDRPDGRRRAQEFPGALRGPAREARLLVGLVLPEHLELLDTSPFGSSSDEIARDGKNGLDMRRWRQQSVQRVPYSAVQLLRRGTRRHREVQAIHEAGTPQRSETQDSRLGLSGSCFALQNQERPVERSRRHGALRRARLLVVEQHSHVRHGSVRRPIEPPKPLAPDCIGRDATGTLDIVRIRIRLVFERVLIRPELVGESYDPGEQMRQRRRVGHGRPVSERIREPGAATLSQQLRGRAGVVARERLPQLGRSSSRLRWSACRAAMMGEHRVQQADDAGPPFIDDVMQTEKLADVRLIEAEQRFCDVSGRSWRCTRRLVRTRYLELEAGVQLAKIMQEREERQPGGGRFGETVRTGRPDEPRPQHGIAEQRFKARRNVGAMMFETVDAA